MVKQQGLLRFCGSKGAHKEVWDYIKNKQKDGKSKNDSKGMREGNLERIKRVVWGILHFKSNERRQCELRYC